MPPWDVPPLDTYETEPAARAALAPGGTRSKDSSAIPSQLKPIEASALLDLELPKPEPMLGHVLRPGALNMVHGLAGSGKTFLMLGEAVAISHGVDFLGWNVPKPIAVLYVDGEMTAFEMQQRVKALTDPVREHIDHPWRPLHIVTPDLQAGGIPKIDSPEGRAEILRLVDTLEGVGVVFLDNLSCLTNPEDDNAASSWSGVQELLLALRRRGVACVVGHHSGKNGMQRGTSRRADILDVVLKLTPVADGVVDGRTRVQIDFEKGRGMAPAQKVPFIAVLEEHPSGGLTWTRSAASIPIGDRARQMLLDGMSPADVAAELNTARSFIYRVRQQLVESGELADANRRRGQKFRGQGADSAAQSPVVPYAPLIGGRGQGDKRARSRGDKSGDKRGTEGTDP
jgi:hypothetical protein